MTRVKESEQKEEEEEEVVMKGKFHKVVGRILGEVIVESGLEQLKRWGEEEYLKTDAKRILPRITQARSNRAEAFLTFDYADPEINVCSPSGQEESASVVKKRLRDEKGDEGAKKRLKSLILPLISGGGDVGAMAAESVGVNVRLDSEKVPEFWAFFSIPFVDILKGVYDELDYDDDDEEKEKEKEEEKGDRFAFGFGIRGEGEGEI